LSWITELANVTAGLRSVLLPNLRAAATYQFRVSAVNSVGEGTASDPSEEVMLPQESKYMCFTLLQILCTVFMHGVFEKLFHKKKKNK
jgi:hypothetical protein